MRPDCMQWSGVHLSCFYMSSGNSGFGDPAVPDFWGSGESDLPHPSPSVRDLLAAGCAADADCVAGDADCAMIAATPAPPLRTIRWEYNIQDEPGEGWCHAVELEAIDDDDAERAALPVCLGGERACPPDEPLKQAGYDRFLRRLAEAGDDADERDYVLYIHLLKGEGFDPAAFDPASVEFREWGHARASAAPMPSYALSGCARWS